MSKICCKICGKDFSYSEEITVAECPHCGGRQTVPLAGDKTKMDLYSRCIRLMRRNEFEKAFGMYEAIGRFYPNEAETFWGLILCKYGVEFEMSAETGCTEPIIHRPYSESLMDDYNFEMVIDLASEEARPVYRAQAAHIESHRERLIAKTGKTMILDEDPLKQEEIRKARRNMKEVIRDQMEAARSLKLPEEAQHIRAEINALEEKMASFGILQKSRRQELHLQSEELQIRLERIVAAAERERNARLEEIANRFIRVAEPGDTFEFGTYFESSGVKSPIRWRILKKTDTKMLVITDKVIDSRPYNEERDSVTWESCSMRQWLNGEFYESAFSPTEQERIMETLVETDKKSHTGVNQGNDTMDKIFLLSLKEAHRYMDSEPSRRALPTEYAVEKGVMVNPISHCSWWWLRSAGYFGNYAMDVRNNGTVNTFGHFVNYGGGAVRPAMWINLG